MREIEQASMATALCVATTLLVVKFTDFVSIAGFFGIALILILADDDSTHNGRSASVLRAWLASMQLRE